MRTLETFAQASRCVLPAAPDAPGAAPGRAGAADAAPGRGTPAAADAARDRLLRRPDVTRNVALVGADYRFAGAPAQPAEPLLQGLFHTVELRPGLVLHRTSVQDLHDMQTSVTLKPGIKIGLLVDGASELSMGHRDFKLGPRSDGAGRVRNEGVLCALAEPDAFRRQWRRGRRESKVSLTLMPEWLDHGGAAEGPELDRVRAFRQRHLAVEAWEPSARAQALARQIVHPPPLSGVLLALYLESRAVQLAAEALSVVARVAEMPAPTLPLREHRRLRELCAFLDSGQADGLDVDAIARHAGMSATALQRCFRSFTGRTLFEYLRGRRLEAARRALEQEGVTVKQAAGLAGYTCAANFATAFRRRFGTTPREVRARC